MPWSQGTITRESLGPQVGFMVYTFYRYLDAEVAKMMVIFGGNIMQCNP